ALTGLSIGRVCTHPDLRRQADALVSEALTVCAAAGIVLPRSPAEAMDDAVAEAYGHLPSMLQDAIARRPTEIDFLNAGIAAEGRRLGVPTPLHDCMTALVRGAEGSDFRLMKVESQ
ncbi:MAG: ketopantoate reductase family protein, partial [Solirubrobacteraceae bacterium]